MVYVRDKDGVNATLLVCEAAAWYAQQGKTLLDAIEALYKEFGCYRNALCSFAFEGESGMHTMQNLMKNLRANAPAEIAGYKVESAVDYDTDGTGLPRANVLEYHLAGGHKLIFFSQPIKSHGSTTIPRPNRCILSVWVTTENIPLPIQRPVKVLGGAGILTGLVNGLPHPGVPRRFLGLGLLHYRQAVLPTQLVGCCPELGILAAALLVFLAVHIGHGIYHKMIM